MSKTSGFYSMFALSSFLTLAYISILIVPWPTLVFTSKIIQKWCPRRLQLVRKQITNTTWAPTGKKSRQGRPRKPSRRLQDVPGRLQDGSKTAWNRFEIEPAAPTCKKYRQGRPKKPPRRLQDAPGRLQGGSKRLPGRLQDGFSYSRFCSNHLKGRRIGVSP